MKQNVNLEIENAVTSRELVELLPMLFAQNQATMVWGDAGIGKSELSDQIAAATKRKKFDFRLNIREPVDMRGVPVPNMETRTTDWFVPGELPKMDGSDGPCLLVLDEINTGTMQMMAVAMQLVLDRRVGDYVLPKDCAIMAMGNRSKDSRAVVQMPKPLRNRFAHFTMVVDHDSWVAHATKTGLAPELVAFIRFRPDYLARNPQGDENAYASPRSVYKCAPYIGQPTRLRLKAFTALVGKDVGSEMESFVAMYQSLVGIDDILKNPTTAKIPTERSERYAVATALGRLADKANFPAVVTYAERLGKVAKELEIVTITDAVTRDKTLAKTNAYVHWAVANQDVTIQ